MHNLLLAFKYNLDYFSMAKGNLKENEEWVDFNQLRRSIVHQNSILNARRNGMEFDPHKYFGGWDQMERSSIEKIKLDQRLKDMMDYETSNASGISKSYSSSIISESLATPSVADELEPSSPIQK